MNAGRSDEGRRGTVESIGRLKEQVAEYLRRYGTLGRAEVFPAYPAAERRFPLKRPAVAVGLDAVEMEYAGLGGYWGQNGAEALYGGGALITLRFDLFCPLAEGAEELHRLYEELCDLLMLRRNPFGFQRMGCGEVVCNRSAAANTLAVRATLRSAVLLADEEDAIQRIDIIRKEED